VIGASTLRRIGRDFKSRRHVDVYVVAAVTLVLAALSLLGDVVGEDLRSAGILAALSLLTYQIAVPGRLDHLDDVLLDRTAFEDVGIAARVGGAREVWIQAPSAITLLSGPTIEALRRGVLARRDGQVRVMVLDPSDPVALDLATRHLDDTTDYRTDDLPRALRATIDRLETMSAWEVGGTFEYRHIPYNPGYSIVAIDPHARGGLLIVEFHGGHNESTASRMHLELTRSVSERWYAYWLDQLEHLWDRARPPGSAVVPQVETLGAGTEAPAV
jgi:hypothetical protein